MQTLVELTAQDEEAGGGEAVGDHLYHGALQGQLAAGVDGDHHEAHVGDAGVATSRLMSVWANATMAP